MEERRILSDNGSCSRITITLRVQLRHLETSDSFVEPLVVNPRQLEPRFGERYRRDAEIARPRQVRHRGGRGDRAPGHPRHRHHRGRGSSAEPQ